MKIDFIEIKNFRKLVSARIDLSGKQTLFVGANNSGKTSAMVALRAFLGRSKGIHLRDVSINCWDTIDKIGRTWDGGEDKAAELNLEDCLPSLDLWISASIDELHHVASILPSLDWSGGLIGVRLQFTLADLEKCQAAYKAARDRIAVSTESDAGPSPTLKPTCLTDFLENDLSKHLAIEWYPLDPDKINPPGDSGKAEPQKLSAEVIPFETNPLDGLVRVDEIGASRELADADSSSGARYGRQLSGLVRKHFDDAQETDTPLDDTDLDALSALQEAGRAFDKQLKSGLAGPLSELTNLGVPGTNDPEVEFSTQLKGIEGLQHSSAVSYRVPGGDSGGVVRSLPESYAGLGFQNLIYMHFCLIGFRQKWMSSGVTSTEDGTSRTKIEPIHLVLVEEPEAHLHVQVQQVFIRKAYACLRNHSDLGEDPSLTTQLVVSTHSSHVAHEVGFEDLRYFKAIVEDTGHVLQSAVVNLSNVFGDDGDTTRFVKRYLRITDCDVFFADAVIFVEGSAERILVPWFIREHFPKLHHSYISILEVGGAYTHLFKPLIDAIGMCVLVITDLDSVAKTTTDGSGRAKKIPPKRGAGQTTSNPVLKRWHPKFSEIDELLDVKLSELELKDDKYLIRICYQQEVAVGKQKHIPRTFEDALIVENKTFTSNLTGSLGGKIDAILGKDSQDEIETDLFDLVNTAVKADFALDCLMAAKTADDLKPPVYIAAGLQWLSDCLQATPNKTDSSLSAE